MLLLKSPREVGAALRGTPLAATGMKLADKVDGTNELWITACVHEVAGDGHMLMRMVCVEQAIPGLQVGRGPVCITRVWMDGGSGTGTCKRAELELWEG